MIIDTKAGTLVITRIFDASPARVFEAWLVQEEFSSWIGPEGIHCDVPLFEPRVGGRYRLTMHLPDGRALPIAGVFTAIEPNRRFSFTWGGEGDSRQTLVSVELRDLNGRTELILRHEGLPSGEHDGHHKGWNSALNKLGLHLTVEN